MWRLANGEELAAQLRENILHASATLDVQAPLHRCSHSGPTGVSKWRDVAECYMLDSRAAARMLDR